MQPVVEQNWWDSVYASSELRYRAEDVVFADLFRATLPRGGSAFEIGCYPGKFLIWLSREMGYTVSGVDLTPQVDQLPAYMRSLGVEVGQITRGNFFDIPAAPEHDLVCSFGFIEHFASFPEVLRRHAAFLRPGGWLVVSCPNFRRGQRLLHRLLDAQNLARHHLPAMSFHAWEAALKPVGIRPVRTAYVGTCEFWSESEGAPRWNRALAGRVASASRRIDRAVSLPNRWFSPYMVMFARKEA